MTPTPFVAHRPELVVIEFGCGCKLYLSPEGARSLASNLTKAAGRASVKPDRDGPCLSLRMSERLSPSET
jgi:hypothetical protein